MKVFISSVIAGFEDMRAAARTAVETLGHSVIQAEDFGASPQSPQVACLSGLRDADLVIVLLGERYGAIQPSGLSATHEEFREAQGRKDVIAFVQEVPHRETGQVTFIDEVQDWQGGLFTQSFVTATDLELVVTRAVHNLVVERARAVPDESELRNRAIAALPTEPRGYTTRGTTITLSIAGAPRQTLLRPSQIEGDDLDQLAFGHAFKRDHPIFVRSEGTTRSIDGNVLRLKQLTRSIAIHPDGTLAIQTPIETGSLMVLIEESVADALENGLKFFDALLRGIDQTESLRHVCIAATILGSSHRAWRTRAQNQASPDSVQINPFAGERGPVFTPVMPRASIRTIRNEITEDLIVLLRRGFQ